MPEYFSIESAQMEALARRIDELSHWLRDKAPFCEIAQKHLDSGTAEQAYWNFGYLCALRDVVSMINRRLVE